jgi:hypothetical protein
MLKSTADFPHTAVWGRRDSGSVDFYGMASLPRLLDKQLIIVVGQFEQGHPAYQATPLGRVAAQLLKNGLRTFQADRATKDNSAEPDQDK